MKLQFNTASCRFYIIALLSACNLQLAAQHTPPATPYPTGTPVNFVRTWVASKPQSDPATFIAGTLQEVKMTTQYIDGIGRPMQTVARLGSLQTSSDVRKDLVMPVEYDIYGRESYKYQPYVAATADGSFQATPFTDHAAFMGTLYSAAESPWYYSQANFEPSPLNRPVETYAAGTNWVGTASQAVEANRHGIKMKYWLNTDNDVVRLWNTTTVSNSFGTYSNAGVYAAGQLYKTANVDEHNKQVIEFHNKEGQLILKKVQIITTAGTEDDGTGRGHAGWLCTYYIYDQLNRLACVIPPKAVERMSVERNWSNNYLSVLCFRYAYDARNQMIMKQVPGTVAVYMVYDGRGRLVMMRDGKLATAGKWMVTKYDVLNRPVETGLWTSATDGAAFATHLSAAYNSTSYPTTSGTYEQLTVNHYDDYASLPSGLSAYLITWNSNFSSTSLSWPYPQMPAVNNGTRGLATWSQSKVLNSASTFLNSVSYYDDQGRVVQMQSTNISGGTDVTSSQFSWSGQPLIVVQKEQKQGTNAQTAVIVTTNTYDDLGRVANIKKRLQHTLVNSNTMSTDKTIVTNQYDNLGQLKQKTLGTGLETLVYDYNIRGWLLGINRAYLGTIGQSGSTKFGYELGYDKTANSTGAAFTSGQYNGNITGMIWKSDGDDVRRKYDYTYDAANRILQSSFNQDNESTTWNHISMDFTTRMGDGINPATAYDANGNILAMKQWGVKLTGTTIIDDLKYTYMPASNKLQNVVDFNNDPSSKLGDYKTKTESFQYDYKLPLTPASPQEEFDDVQDYDYDNNGNLLYDANKGITSIEYNHLNLPYYIYLTTDVSGVVNQEVDYTYNAGGNKLTKEVTDQTGFLQNIKTKSTYIGGFVFESKITTPSAVSDYTDVLQYIPHEEGRIRFRPADATRAASFQYDYFIKDHLGNVRMVLTEENITDIYPYASLEPAKINTEKQFYSIADAQVTTVSGVPAYINNGNGIGNNPTDATFDAANSSYMYKLNGNSESTKTGLGITLKVMAGDIIDIYGKSYTPDNNAGGVNNTLLVNTIINGLLGGATGASATSLHGPVAPANVNPGNSSSGIPAMMTSQASQAGGTQPRAFINYILFDEQFNAVDFRVSMVNTPGIGAAGLKQHTDLTGISVPKNGFVYIYCSNESPVNVYFDNLQVKHRKGPLMEETHYYPFGLTMAAISTKSAGGLESKNKFQGQEFAHNEFTDGSGLEMYEFKYRMDDPQIGRFWQVDPLADKYVYNSTYAFSENKVVAHIELEGLESVGFGWNILKKAVAEEFQATANSIDHTLSKEHEFKAVTAITSSTVGNVTVSNNFVLKVTTEKSTNFGGFMNYLLYTNKGAGSNESMTKTVTETKEYMELGVVVKGAIGTLNGAVSVDSKGVVTTEGGGTVNLVRVPVTLGGSVSTSTDGKIEVNVQAGLTNTPINVIGTYSQDWDSQSIGVGFSTETKVGKTTITTTDKVKIKF